MSIFSHHLCVFDISSHSPLTPFLHKAWHVCVIPSPLGLHAIGPLWLAPFGRPLMGKQLVYIQYLSTHFNSNWLWILRAFEAIKKCIQVICHLENHYRALHYLQVVSDMKAFDPSLFFFTFLAQTHWLLWKRHKGAMTHSFPRMVEPLFEVFPRKLVRSWCW